MAEEQVTRGSAGRAQRQSRRPRELAEPIEARENLDERERHISPRRKPMGPVVPLERDPGVRAADATPTPDVPPTDPR